MRKQYYFRPSARGLLAWDVDRLIQHSSRLPRKRVALSELRVLDAPWFGEDERPTWRAMLEHIRLIEEADLSFPIILSASGAVMDGRHRVAKAALQGHNLIEAVQFDVDPEPDYVGLGPDELPYDEAVPTTSSPREMARPRARDLERTYSAKQFAAKLRRLADAVEEGRPFTIQVAGETLRIPAAATFNVEHERGRDGSEELEFQLRWTR